MNDISLCADYTTCGNYKCDRHAEQYVNQGGIDRWQGWTNAKDTDYCPGWQEKEGNDNAKQ